MDAADSPSDFGGFWCVLIILREDTWLTPCEDVLGIWYIVVSNMILMMCQLSTIFLTKEYTSLIITHHCWCEVIVLSLRMIPAGYHCWPVYSLLNRVGDLEFHDKEASNSRSSKNIRIPNQSEIGHHFPAICLKASFEGTVFHMLQNSTTHT